MKTATKPTFFFLLLLLGSCNSGGQKEFDSIYDVEKALDYRYEYKELILSKETEKRWVCWVRRESLSPWGTAIATKNDDGKWTLEMRTY